MKQLVLIALLALTMHLSFIPPVTAQEQHQRENSASVPANAYSGSQSICSSLLFNEVGQLTTGRFVHTANLLPDGKVLVVGGGNLFGELLPSLVYDPKASNSTEVEMVQRRGYHTSTTLHNGDVLVSGGEDEVSPGSASDIMPLGIAELYQPSANTFSPVTTMVISRTRHAATLLSSGRVLLTGGWSVSTLASAEEYDPSVQRFTQTGDMQYERMWHTATLLGNREVLVVGGIRSDDPLRDGEFVQTSELYNEDTQQFSTTASLQVPRAGHTATLLQDGRVLIAGGRTGGAQEFPSLLEIYDPQTGRFTSGGPMVTPRAYHTATLLPNGKVLLAGGFNRSAPGLFLSSVELFDPEMNTITITSEMNVGRQLHTATLLPNGSVLFFGGYSWGSTPGIELFNYNPFACSYMPLIQRWEANSTYE
jgi:hypothetical protein